LLIHDPAAGSWNMAVDEVLAETAADQGLCSLRFYQWREPTLSLGYFQKYAERESYAPSHELACVRRASGGGAIVHDRELTYTLAVPVAHPLAVDAMQLYNAVHESLIEAMSHSGITAQQCIEPGRLARDAEPFLCFLRRAIGDVLISRPDFRAAKICGSAQRRRRGAIVQHGSILLAASDFAPELPGIKELSGQSLTASALSTALGPILSRRLAVALNPATLTPAEEAAAEQFALDKYLADSWTRRR